MHLLYKKSFFPNLKNNYQTNLKTKQTKEYTKFCIYYINSSFFKRLDKIPIKARVKKEARLRATPIRKPSGS